MRESTFFQSLPQQLLYVLIAAAVLALVGPYGTYRDLPLDLRAAYWTLCMLTGWILMTAIGAGIDRIEPLQGWPVVARMVVAGFIGGVPMTAIAWSAEALFRRVPPMADLPYLLMDATVLTIVVSVAIGQAVELRLRSRAGTTELTTPSPAAPPPTPPCPAEDMSGASEPVPPRSTSDAFLRRLPPELGRDLLALEMEDHYARVHTALGSTLILLRLRDAVAELGESSGLQVHRSWWVAHGAVAQADREAGKLALVLRNGVRVPVSKTYRDAVKASGWLDR
ncbi:LytTR family DNA-binding domain-containing protein [Reyranella sp. CPCC 100927]|uniref:LytTR family DNA-binding domain-containing protein n=1 Tax=Reyranella sp. CPCC 100927 TaxID=2599616 RepID=UPI0011B4D42D|nr:LytTR family DNA-binding domain-containing protein [Reyranella sp. CPCC 100927]TWT03055.1 LytTR family transcriptional regulator [Reyranella sp. CPCC 100927]